MKKIISLVMCVALTLTLVCGTVFATENPSSWAEEEVTAAIAANLVPQSLQSQYAQATTRAEFCALAVALYENAIGEIKDRKTFIDTADINVEKCAVIGVVHGTNAEGTLFNPDNQLTREEAATMLSRLAAAIGRPLTTQTASFADVGSISSWALEAVGQVQTTGIMSGVGNNLFSPQASYTREQSILTIFRLHDYAQSHVAMFSRWPTIPAFGVFADAAMIELDTIGESTFLIYEISFDNDKVNEYFDLLQAHGFIYDGSFESEDGSLNLTYTRNDAVLIIGELGNYTLFQISIRDLESTNVPSPSPSPSPAPTSYIYSLSDDDIRNAISEGAKGMSNARAIDDNYVIKASGELRLFTDNSELRVLSPYLFITRASAIEAAKYNSYSFDAAKKVYNDSFANDKNILFEMRLAETEFSKDPTMAIGIFQGSKRIELTSITGMSGFPDRSSNFPNDPAYVRTVTATIAQSDIDVDQPITVKVNYLGTWEIVFTVNLKNYK